MPSAPILILAPKGRDAEVIRLVMDEAGIPARVCADLSEICRGLGGEATALLVTEEALLAGYDGLLECLDAQPPWSDIPVILLTSRGDGRDRRARLDDFGRLGNVTLLDRPLHADTLKSAARAAERARRRQYRTRSHLRQIEQAAGQLERRVAEQSRDLETETAQRERVEEALRQAQKMEAVGQLTGGVAHDFNNLLQAILGNLDMLQEGLAGQERLLRYVRAATQAGERAATLTRRLLAFARRQPLQPGSLSLNALVGGMQELLQRSVGEAIQVEAVLAGGLWRTWADANQVENALLNLAINARDAMPNGGRLTIETANSHLDDAYVAAELGLQPGQYVVLCVTDTGTGMSAEVRARAFEPFFTTKPIGQGTGLGLSQLYGFARQSGGHAAIYSEEGRGTTVKLYLPRHRGPVPEEAAPALPEPEEAEEGETILVVEDEALVRLLLVQSLEDRGYRVIEAPEPQAAIKVLESDAKIDLLATDVGLPGLNGRQLAEIARRARPDLAVLFLTGYAHNAALGDEPLGPRTQLLSKPFAVKSLLSKVRAMLEGGD
ncbi:response regulator (plasmid) [Skermanella sp. TT6]|uniref:histidine kinase n=1 Tax=Skermanella cutis TaxID=2775420 RepID=A0ABX7BGA4_9PROT|nr:ATP-binding protein [Skermanella sp. TT6]QQP93404.1 response regulator [Skermanella sp. TT6]